MIAAIERGERTQLRIAPLEIGDSSGAGPKARPGNVGRPIPGVEIKIDAPNPEGVGEILARGPNVMLGYSDDPEGTSQVIDPDGWLRTGDLGKLDRR